MISRCISKSNPTHSGSIVGSGLLQLVLVESKESVFAVFAVLASTLSVFPVLPVLALIQKIR